MTMLYYTKWVCYKNGGPWVDDESVVVAVILFLKSMFISRILQAFLPFDSIATE